MSTAVQSKVLSVAFNDKANLYSAYMPFIKQGAIFIHTNDEYQLGDEVFVLLQLLNDPEQHSVAGKVIWITPKCAQGGRRAGIGLQFNMEGQVARGKIETLLAGALNSERRGDTL